MNHIRTGLRLLAAMTAIAVFAACSGGNTPKASSPSPTQPNASNSGSATGSPTAGATGSVGSRQPTANPSKTGKEPASTFTGITGTVLVHPDCYYASTPCDQPSYTLRDARVEARNAQGGVIASTVTNSSGAYQMRTAAGRYTLSASGGNAPTWNGDPVRDCRSKQVTVQPGQLAQGDLECRY